MTNKQPPVNSIEFDLDVHGQITAVSTIVERTMGYKPEELIGQPFISLVHFQDLEGLQDRWVSALRGEVSVHELRMLGKCGEIRRMRALVRPLLDHGLAIGLTEVLTDIKRASRNLTRPKPLAPRVAGAVPRSA
jgi:PAS domain S-box-containing protein